MSASLPANRGPLLELEPLWPDAPRLCPFRPFPPYRFVPGLHPHPAADPAGHSYGKEEEPTALPAERWRENSDYLYGIDLYHQGYLWESHEVWEGLWRKASREDIQGLFLQGLIQNSAAQLKLHLNAYRGASSLSRYACARMELVLASGNLDLRGDYMGLNVAGLLYQMQEHYAPLWTTVLDPAARVVGRPPRLVVSDITIPAT